MRNNIFALSRDRFKKEISQLSEQQFLATAFISIHEPKRLPELFGDASDSFLDESENVLNLWFNDCEEDLPDVESVLFDEEMGRKLINFIEKNKDKKQWVLHCTAGISRSGAIGEFLADYFGIAYHLFKRDNSQVKPNTLVKNIMRKYL